jgi:2-polyprenyl-3-methyl-5-hydroxy-6-metoxy-1,4-benzoquinol methylase
MATVAETIHNAVAIEQRWIHLCPELRREEEHPQEYGWEPYPPLEFANLLSVAIAYNPTGRFLDVGAGIGTKVLIAARMGLDAHGLELYPQYVEAAREMGANVRQWDVRNSFSLRYGIVYINHPLRDTEAEDLLEYRIQHQVAPGTVLITVNNIRTLPEDWNVICRPLWSDPERLRFDWVAVKPGGENGSG